MGRGPTESKVLREVDALLQLLRSMPADDAPDGDADSPRRASGDPDSALLAALFAASLAVRRAVAASLTDRDAANLEDMVAHRSAVAVRSGDAVHLRHALLALALAFERTADWCDTLRVLALPWDAAGRIGVPPAPLFLETSALVPTNGAAFLRSFATRRPEDQTIEAMSFVAVEGADGFGYRQAT